MEEWNFMSSAWALSASFVFNLLIWTILSRKFLKYALYQSRFVAIRSGKIMEEFNTTAYLRGDLSSSTVDIDQMKVMQSFLKDLTDSLVTVSFFSKLSISVVEPKLTSVFFFRLSLFVKFILHKELVVFDSCSTDDTTIFSIGVLITSSRLS